MTDAKGLAVAEIAREFFGVQLHYACVLSAKAGMPLAEVRSATRAAVIARTETARAYALGSLAAWQVSGEVAASEWLTAGDELECPICAPLNGQQANLGRPFAGGLYYPPAHPNCRCALLPVLT